MSARTTRASGLALAGLLVACTSPAPPGPPAAAPVPAAPAARPVAATPQPGAPGAKPTLPGLPERAALEPRVPEAPTYEARGRRDPFESLEVGEGASGLRVAATKLTGIIRSARVTLALVEAPDGIGYILKPGDTLGDGRLLEIGSDSVVFAVTPRGRGSANRVVLKLATNP